MNGPDENLVAVFRDLRGFCNSVSKLLRTATDQLNDRGWRPAQPASVFAVSRAIDQPSSWLPYEFCRLFENTQFPDRYCYVAVNLGHPNQEYSPNCALLSAGCIHFEERTIPYADHWWSRWHLGMTDRNNEGRICIDEPRKTHPETEWNGIRMVKTFAYPLVEIDTGQKLDEKIIGPLLELVAGPA
jgi:hypothetical protein